MNDRQRIVLVIGSGLAIAVLARALDEVLKPDGDGGWFAYAPGTTPIFSPMENGAILRTTSVWVGAVIVWTVVAVWLLRRRSEP